jgi:hypothetical protein
MNCPTPEELNRWVDGTIDSASERAIAAHAGACARCLRKASELRAAVDWIENASIPGPRCLSAEEMAAVLDGAPAPAHVRVCPRCAAELSSLGVPARRATIRHYRRRSEVSVWVAAAAALLAAGLALLVVATRTTPNADVAKESPKSSEARPAPAPVRLPPPPPPPPPPPIFVPNDLAPAPDPVPPPAPDTAPVPPAPSPVEPSPVPPAPVDPVPAKTTVAEAPRKAIPLAVRSGGLSALVEGKWVRSAKVVEGTTLRAEGRTSFDFSGAHLTADTSSRFALFDGEIALHEGGVAAEVPAGVKIAVAIGDQKIVPQTTSARALLVARPDRVVVEEGAARVGTAMLAEGVEHQLKKGRLEPQKRRSLPAAPRPREFATWKLDFSKPDAIRPRLAPGRLILDRERMIGSVPMEANPFFYAQVGYAVFDERGFFQVKAGTTIRFRYYLTHPVTVEIVMKNLTKDENFNKPFEAVVGQWTTVTLPVRDVPVNPGGKKVTCDLGDRYTGFGLFVGRPDERAELFIDQLEILEIDR